jgi:N-acetyl-gamma-glutamyl-phosphate reductase
MLEKAKFIDLSADYRIKDVDVYEEWYKMEHGSPELIEEAVYGLCEVNREKIRNTRLLANPGCYTTCSILTAYPLVKEHLIDPATLVINALSGVSGAGRGAKVANLFCEVNENAKAYGVGTHRHTPEIEEQLSYAYDGKVTINFTPHLVPMNRGILVTETADLNGGAGYDEIRSAYEKYYKDEKFIKVMPFGAEAETGGFLSAGDMAGRDDACIYVTGNDERLLLNASFDNLGKGASGAAIQCMNIVMGVDEATGLNIR